MQFFFLGVAKCWLLVGFFPEKSIFMKMCENITCFLDFRKFFFLRNQYLWKCGEMPYHLFSCLWKVFPEKLIYIKICENAIPIFFQACFYFYFFCYLHENHPCQLPWLRNGFNKKSCGFRAAILIVRVTYSALFRTLRRRRRPARRSRTGSWRTKMTRRRRARRRRRASPPRATGTETTGLQRAPPAAEGRSLTKRRSLGRRAMTSSPRRWTSRKRIAARQWSHRSR